MHIFAARFLGCMAFQCFLYSADSDGRPKVSLEEDQVLEFRQRISNARAAIPTTTMSGASRRERERKELQQLEDLQGSGQRALVIRSSRSCIIFILFFLAPASSSKPDSTAVLLVQKDMSALLNQTAGDAAASAVKFLNSKWLREGHLELQEADLSTVRIWSGPDVSLALQVGDVEHRFFSGAALSLEDEYLTWVPVRHKLPTSLGGILEKGDWDALDVHLVRPLRDGATLADFTLAGPLDLYFSPPTEVEMWLPYPTEGVGPLKRVLLREGATVTVRGARSAALRRPVELPSLGVADFVDFAMEDMAESRAAGILHLAAGLRQAAATKWNRSSETLGTTPAVVSLEVAFSGGEAALVAAPGDAGVLQRLKVRRVGESAGVVELLPSGGQLTAAEGSKALALAKKHARYVWPLRGSTPESVAAYEHILQEVLAHRVFGRGSSGGSSSLRPMPDFPLRLQRSTAEAVLLMEMEMVVVRKESETEAAVEEGGSGGDDGDASSGSSSSSSLRKDLREEGWSIASAAAGDDPPTPEQLLMDSMSLHGLAGGAGFFVGGKSGKKGPKEVWSVVVRVEGNAREGLRFVPLQARQVDIQRLITATFSPSALINSMGLGRRANDTQLNLLAAE